MNVTKATGSLLAMEAALKGLTKATGTLCLEEIQAILVQLKAVQEKVSGYVPEPAPTKVLPFKQTGPQSAQRTPGQQSRWDEAQRRLEEYRKLGESELEGGTDALEGANQSADERGSFDGNHIE